jgi:hypothetical protein
LQKHPQFSLLTTLLSPRETDASVLFSQAEQTTTSGLYAVVGQLGSPKPTPAALAGVSPATTSARHISQLVAAPPVDAPARQQLQERHRQRESHHRRCTKPTCSALTPRLGSYRRLALAAAHGKCGGGASHGSDDGGRALQIRWPRARIYTEKCQAVRGRLGSFGVAGGALAAWVRLRRCSGARMAGEAGLRRGGAPVL